MNQMPGQPVSTIEDSVLRGHDAANRAFQVLDSIDADLSGAMQNAAGAGTAAVSGLVYAADDLAARINILADRLENIRARIASPKVVSMTQGMAQGSYNPKYTG